MPFSDYQQVLIWRICVLASAYSRILNGLDIMILHGAALKIQKRILLLCGQSGMGKSTVANRWKASGGEVLCDDMVLLEQTSDGTVVHPLPTWSRCMKSMTGENVNFPDHYPVRSVLALNRSKNGVESLDTANRICYYSTVYSSCCAFLPLFIRRMPGAEQKKLRQAAISWTDRLVSGEQLMLYADLNGNLKDTLKSFY